MNGLKRTYLCIALIAIVSLVGSATAQSVTISATMPQDLNIDFPQTSNFGQLTPNTPTTTNNQIHVSANCNWGLSVYAQDDGFGHHGHLTQQSASSMHDFIRNPVSFTLTSPPYNSPANLENYYSYNPYQLTSGGSGDTYLNYQLSTQSSGFEDSRYPYIITIDFILNAQ